MIPATLAHAHDFCLHFLDEVILPMFAYSLQTGLEFLTLVIVKNVFDYVLLTCTLTTCK